MQGLALKRFMDVLEVLLMSEEFYSKIILQAFGKFQYQKCAPRKTGLRSLATRGDVGLNKSTPTSPFAQPIVRKACYRACVSRTNHLHYLDPVVHGMGITPILSSKASSGSVEEHLQL